MANGQLLKYPTDWTFPTIIVNNAVGGTFTLTVEGALGSGTTTPLSYTAATVSAFAAAVQAALQALTNVGTGNVRAAGGTFGMSANFLFDQYVGVTKVTCDDSELVGPSGKKAFVLLSPAQKSGTIVKGIISTLPITGLLRATNSLPNGCSWIQARRCCDNSASGMYVCALSPGDELQKQYLLAGALPSQPNQGITIVRIKNATSGTWTLAIGLFAPVTLAYNVIASAVQSAVSTALSRPVTVTSYGSLTEDCGVEFTIRYGTDQISGVGLTSSLGPIGQAEITGSPSYSIDPADIGCIAPASILSGVLRNTNSCAGCPVGGASSRTGTALDATLSDLVPCAPNCRPAGSGSISLPTNSIDGTYYIPQTFFVPPEIIWSLSNVVVNAPSQVWTGASCTGTPTTMQNTLSFSISFNGTNWSVTVNITGLAQVFSGSSLDNGFSTGTTSSLTINNSLSCSGSTPPAYTGGMVTLTCHAPL